MIHVAEDPYTAVEKALGLFGDDILRLAFSYLKRKEDAEDIVQETLLRLMQSAPVFENEEHMKAWLLRVAANLCKDFLKQARIKREVSMEENEWGYGQEEPQKDRPDEEQAVWEAVMSLPEKYRTVIHLYYYEEYSTKEIAEILGMKDVTVRSLLKRGREKLAKKIQGGDGYAKGV